MSNIYTVIGFAIFWLCIVISVVTFTGVSFLMWRDRANINWRFWK